MVSSAGLWITGLRVLSPLGLTYYLGLYLLCPWARYTNPNTQKSYKILQRLSPKHAERGVAQSTYPIYSHGKAGLSKQLPWRAAGTLT